jgi:hypothetical protein
MASLLGHLRGACAPKCDLSSSSSSAAYKGDLKVAAAGGNVQDPCLGCPERPSSSPAVSAAADAAAPAGFPGLSSSSWSSPVMGTAAPTPQCDREVGAIIVVSVLFGVTLLMLVFLAAYACKCGVALPAAGAGARAGAGAGAGAGGDRTDVEAVRTTGESAGTSDVFLTARTGASSMRTCSSSLAATSSSRVSSLAPVARVRVGDRVLTSELEDSVTGSYSVRDLEARLQALKQ